MSFNPENCAIPTFYCGDKARPPSLKRGDDSYYTRKGNARECLAKGFGAGMVTEKLKHLPENSLQTIKYVGDVFETKFQEQGIRNTDDLVLRSRKMNAKELGDFLKEVLVKKDGSLDKKSYNSTLLYLYKHGANDLPACFSL